MTMKMRLWWIAMLATSLVIIWTDDDVGVSEMRRERILPLTCTADIGGRRQAYFPKIVSVLFALSNPDRSPLRIHG